MILAEQKVDFALAFCRGCPRTRIVVSILTLAVGGIAITSGAASADASPSAAGRPSCGRTKCATPVVGDRRGVTDAGSPKGTEPNWPLSAQPLRSPWLRRRSAHHPILFSNGSWSCKNGAAGYQVVVIIGVGEFST
jgi:hypothetical protein